MRRLFGALLVSIALLAPALAVAQEEPQPEPSPTATPAPAEEEAPPEFRQRPKIVPPFLWYEKNVERQSTFFMLMMVWWQADNPERSYQTFFPVFYSRLNKATGARTTASPLFYWYTSPTTKAGYIPPVYIERGKDVSRTGVPPIFWYGRVKEETTSYLFPLYFYDERAGRRVLATPVGGGWGSKDDWQGLVGPYYWRNTHTETVDVDAHVLFPVFWHVKTKTSTTWVGGPGFYSKRLSARGGEKKAYGVLPLFYRRTSPGGSGTTVTPLSVFERKDAKTSFLVTPLGGYSTAPGKALVVVGPWIDSYSSETGERFSALFPIAFHGSGRSGYDGQSRYSWTVVGPYFERKRMSPAISEDGAKLETASVDRALLPLFWYNRTGKDLSFVSPGVIFKRDADGDFRGLFGPFYRSWSDEHQMWVLLPGLWYRRDEKMRGFGALPLYYVNTRRDATYAGLFPVVFFHNRVEEYDQKRRRGLTVLPLFHYAEKPGSLTVLSPLYFQIRQPGGERRIMAGWLYWDHKGPDHRTTTFAPFYHWERNGSDRRLLTLAGGYSAGEGHHQSLWGPVYKHRVGELGIKDDVVFPFYWNLNRPERRFFLAGPYYRRNEGEVLNEGVAPFWFHSSYPGASQTIAFPFFLARRDKIEKTRSYFTLLGGLWLSDKEGGGYKLLAPLVYQEKQPGIRRTVLFPMFWYDYDHGMQQIVVPPFYTRRTKDTLDVAVVPAFFYRREPRHTLLLTPGVFHLRDADARTTVVLPLLYGWQRNEKRSAGIAGPWIWSKSRTDKDDYFRLLLPVFLHARKGDNITLVSPIAAYARRSRSEVFLLPGVGLATRENGEGKTVSYATLLGPIYVRQAPEAGELVVFPLFWHARGHGNATTALFPVFHYRKAGEARQLLTVLGGGGSDPATDSSWWWVLNTFHTRQGDRRAIAFMPLAYYEASKLRTTVASPLFYHRAEHDTRTTTTLAPLFYRRTSPEQSTWVAFPLAFSSTDKRTDTTTTAVFPLGIRTRTPERTLTVVPLGLTYYDRRGDDHIGVYGPLVDVKIGERRTVALVPIFRYQREGDTASFASLPFIVWLKRDGYTRAFVGIGYWNTETGTRVFPGYGRWQTRDENGKVRRTTEVALPLYVRYKTPTKELVVVAPFYRTRRADGTRRHGVAPFWSEELRKGGHSWSVLGDLIAYDRIGKYSQMTYLFGFQTKPKKVKPKGSKAKAGAPLLAATMIGNERTGFYAKADGEIAAN